MEELRGSMGAGGLEAVLGDVPEGWAPYGPLAVALAARAVEAAAGGRLVGGGRLLGGQVAPLLGSRWGCEYFVDYGARAAQALRGGVEGFVVKGAVLERCRGGGGFRERVFYPVVRGRRGLSHLLPLVGGERERQAAVYLAELAAVLALASRGGVLVVRHGALVQQVGVYLNRAYDLDCDVLRAVLSYSTLDAGVAGEVVAASRVVRGGGGCNAGLAALRMLRLLAEAARDSGSVVVGLAEEVARTRYLSLMALAGFARLYGGGGVNAAALLSKPVEEAIDCIMELGVGASEARYELPRTLEEALARSLGAGPDGDPVRAIAQAAGGQGLEVSLYKGQVLNGLGVSSDAEVVMVYRFLYGPREPGLTPPAPKGGLVAALVEDSARVNGLEDRLDDGDLRALRGYRMTYMVVDPTPTCRELAEAAGRAGLSVQRMADLVRVRHPLKLEYHEHWEGEALGSVAEHLYTQAQATLYGVPSPLLVVDQRSRVSEWDASIIRGVLEALSRRVVPYSTFVRTYRARTLYTTA